MVTAYHDDGGELPASWEAAQSDTARCLVVHGCRGGNLVVYFSMNARTEVLQFVRDVTAGSVMRLEDLRPIVWWLDPIPQPSDRPRDLRPDGPA